MEGKCIRCGKPTDRTIAALEVRTLHVRGMAGESLVQALGDEKAAGVCDECAGIQREQTLKPMKSAAGKLTGFCLVLAAGVLTGAAAILFADGQTVFVLLTVFAVICGIVGIYDALQNAQKRCEEFRKMNEQEAMEEAAWDVFVAEEPARENNENLTYIPMNEKTRRRKNGDLMILYHLLPEIAVEAWKRLHPENETKEDTHDQTYCDVQNQG